MDPDLRLNTKLGLIHTQRVSCDAHTHTLFVFRLNFHIFKGFLRQDGIKNFAKKPINDLEN